MTVNDVYRIAFEHHLAGRLKEAEQLYRQILQQAPAHADAMHMLGVIGLSTGHAQAGAELIEKALAINPKIPGAWNNLAEARRALKQNDAAMESYRRAIEQEPDAPEPHNNLGILLQDTGSLDEAIASYRRAISLQPKHGEAQNNLAGALANRGEHEQAVELYRSAIRSLPGHAQIHNNLARSLDRLCRWPEAEVEVRRAIALDPNFVEALSNLASIQFRIGHYSEAKQTADRALQLSPDHAPTQWTRGLLDLLRGDYVAGWKGYAQRWRVPSLPRPRTFSQPMWDGSPLNGKTILVHHEQGFGDMIQLARYLPMIAQRGGRVILEIQPELADLMRSIASVDRVVAAGETLPEFDVFIPIFNLPELFGTTLETIPRDVPYLSADSRRAEKFRERLAFAKDKPLIGINWWGKPWPDPRRSIETELLRPVVEAAQSIGAQLVSLQKNAPGVPPLPGEFHFTDLANDLNDFADTAAAMSLMDLIITIDSGPAHLAGALAKPTWTLLPFTPDWRWHLDREDSPWYPTMRLFRQTANADWKPVIARISEELKSRGL